MDSYGDMLVEDLIECDVDDSEGGTHAVWTEQALDLFMSQLQSVNKNNFSSEREMLKVVTNKMAHRNFSFSLEQIEHKFNSLRKMYIDKREKKQAVEQELIKLFGDIKPSSSKRQHSEDSPQSTKQSRITIIDDNSRSPHQNKSDDEVTYDENGKVKMIWSTQANRFFLDLLEEHRPLLGTKFRTKKQMWEEISKRLKTRGFHMTWAQVENKWKYLVRHYRSRLEMLRNNENSRSNSPNKSAFPELFKEPSKSPPSTKPPAPKKKKLDDMKISFANDQKLPFDDDDEDEDDGTQNPLQFEEAFSLPETNNSTSNYFDPVHIDVKPTSAELNASSSTFSKLDQIVKELSDFRKDSRKYQQDSLAIKKQELEAYKERTKQFTKIGETLKELLSHMRNRDGDF